MDEVLDYQFGPMQQTNDAVQQRLGELRTTLEAFKATYTRLAGEWGGAAAEGATGVAKSIDDFGNEVAAVVQKFLASLQEHLDASISMEKSNTDLFT